MGKFLNTMRSLLCVAVFISLLLLISVVDARKNKKKALRLRQCGKKQCPASTNKPVCGSNGKTYSSECHFKFAKCWKPSLKIVQQGSCQVIKPAVIKKNKKKPVAVCGSNGKTYPSKRKFRKAKRNSRFKITIKHKGECSKPVKKTKKNRRCKNGKCRKGPVCDNSGVQYRNFRSFFKAKMKNENLRKVPCPLTTSPPTTNPGS